LRETTHQIQPRLNPSSHLHLVSGMLTTSTGEPRMIDLGTTYLGLNLRSPIVASSCGLWKDLDNLRRLEESGAGAVVLHSLFEEQIMLDSFWFGGYLNQGADTFPEAMAYFPDRDSYAFDPSGYLKHIEAARKTVKMPVIGSLNGVSTGGWVNYARQIESAGADALELNIYSIATSIQTTAQEVEQAYCELVRDIKSQVRIPVSVKLSPYFTAIANVCRQLDLAGVDALVMFNRFYQPDFDVETREVVRSLNLSTSEELRLRLHWVALLSPYLRPQLAITGGIHTALDVVKGIMAGAQVVMTTSALIKRGISYLELLESDLLTWLESHDYKSTDALRGRMNSASVTDPAAFMRASYLKTISGAA
jgi:dihydroorotate dehydrogenase (fumarate)